MLGYSNTEKKKGGPRIAFPDISLQNRAIFQFFARFGWKSTSTNKYKVLWSTCEKKEKNCFEL